VTTTVAAEAAVTGAAAAAVEAAGVAEAVTTAGRDDNLVFVPAVEAANPDCIIRFHL